MIFIIGCLSLLGILMISMKEKTLDKILFILVAFATGTILATALFDLIPESLHHLEELNAEGAGVAESLLFTYVIIGFVIFFIIERFIYWFHGHAHQKEDQFVCYETLTEGSNVALNRGANIKNFALLNLIGDGLHNFLDGIIIMVAFLSGMRNGVIITLAVLFHELPQEIGDFGILVYGGFTKKKALFFNFLSAMIALLGGLLALFLSDTIEVFNLFFLAFSGGGFLYIATTELMPELIKEKNLKKSIIQASIFLCGLILIMLLVGLIPHA
ncbi:MAG: ZIP family metal transporter [Candidatus Lokiarchaeota archaeon]|nr:ZIP family metal transporter [Candidatus Lokiarchaeota archaeon]